MIALRRYEILLPSKFNDGRPVPQELIAETLLELEQKFDSVSCETQIIHRIWRHEARRIATRLPAFSWMCPTRRRTASSSFSSKKN